MEGERSAASPVSTAVPTGTGDLDRLLVGGLSRRGRDLVGGSPVLDTFLVFPEHLPTFLVTLLVEVRTRRLGSLCATGLQTLIGTQIEIPPPAHPVTVENAILFRCVEPRSHLRRLVPIAIGPGGIDIVSAFPNANAVLSVKARSNLSPGFGMALFSDDEADR